MQKNIVSAVCACLLTWNVFSQSTIESILQQVEQNNQELNALSAYMDSRQFELKSGNNLPDPQFGVYYLPFGDHTPDDYTEFQLSQTFEFPTVYGARSGLIHEQSIQLELEYQVKRLEVLSSAKSYCLQLIYSNKRLITVEKRLEMAVTVYEQVQELYEKEQVGILELNKAKVAWMQDQFMVQQIENDKRNVLLSLQHLNGGIAIDFESTVYPIAIEIGAKDSLWQSKVSKDPKLIQLQHQEMVASQQLKLAKSKLLPNLTAGYNSQGVEGERFSGLYGGITIPLWSNRNKVKAAQSNLEYQESHSVAGRNLAYSSFENQYNDYQMMLTRFTAYQTTLSGLNSENLLMQAYEQGEISFLEYYMELQFYRQAYDMMLEMQHQLFQSKNEILKYLL